MWVESLLHVGDLPVGLSVHRLDGEERERTAAVFAWLTIEAISGSVGSGPAAWNEFVHDLLRDHVTFSVPEEHLEGLGSAWWNEVLGRALRQFVRQNELAPSINRHLETMRGVGQYGKGTSS